MSDVGPKLLGNSDTIIRVRQNIERVAPTPLPVLITGETGTGKEVAARLVHHHSGRSGPFVPVDCAALSQSLVETELFGHERGAFTGAHQRREGLVYAAHAGTFFLDEVGELPLETQTRLLRLLEAGTYRPVGDQFRTPIRTSEWWLPRGATSASAWRTVGFAKISTIVSPPSSFGCRLCASALATSNLLFERFLVEACPTGRHPPTLEAEVRVHLRRWPWPGNVRELKNVASYVAAMTPGGRVRMQDLPPALLRPPPEVSDRGVPTSITGPEVRIDLPYMEARRLYLDDFQQRYVEAVLEAHDGNVSAAARAAGMDRRSIQRILKRAGTYVSQG